MTNYYQKYLKYKQKYLKLQSQSSGAALETPRRPSSQNNIYVLPGILRDGDSIFYSEIEERVPYILFGHNMDGELLRQKISFLNETIKMEIFHYIENEIKKALAEAEYNKKIERHNKPISILGKMDDVFKHIYSNIASLYDNITYLYAFSKNVREYFDSKSIQYDIPITVFNGENASFVSLNESHYKEGINILMGCYTSNLAANKNQKLNRFGKYFIGYRGTIHTYGNVVYDCTSMLSKKSLRHDDYIYLMKEIPKRVTPVEGEGAASSAEETLEEEPIIKLIKFFHFKLHTCIKCRNCNLFDNILFDQNMARLTDLIRTKKSILKDESYFQLDPGYKPEEDICKPPEEINNCIIDINFEGFFKDELRIINQVKEMEKQKENNKKRHIAILQIIREEEEENIKIKLDEHVANDLDKNKDIKINMSELDKYTIDKDILKGKIIERLDVPLDEKYIDERLSFYEIKDKIEEQTFLDKIDSFYINVESLKEYKSFSDTPHNIKKIKYYLDLGDSYQLVFNIYTMEEEEEEESEYDSD